MDRATQELDGITSGDQMSRLWESELRLRQAMQIGRCFPFDWNPLTDEVIRSPECADILGLAGEDVVHDTSQRYFQRILAADREPFVLKIEQLTPASNSYVASYRLVRGDGSIAHFEETGRGFFDSDGNLIRLLGIVADVTERKRAEENEERLKALMRHNPSLIFLKDETGRYIYLNEAYEKQFVRSKDWYEKTDFDFWPRESAELFQANDLNVLASGKLQQFLEDSTDRDGQRHCWLCYKFPFTDSQGRRYLGGIGVDATTRIVAEEALQESERQLALAIGGTGIGMFEWNVVTDECRWNEHYARLLGFVTPTTTTTLSLSYKHTDWAEHVHPDDLPGVEEELRRCMVEHVAFEREYRVVWPDGSVHWIVSRGTFHYDDQDQPQRMLGVVMDITDRKHSEEWTGLLVEVTSQLLASKYPQQIVESLCRTVMGHFDCQVFFNFLVDDEAGRLKLNACAGVPEQIVRQLEWLDMGVAICGCVAQGGCRIVAENIQTSSDMRAELVRSLGIQAYACHPLMDQGQVIGTLSFGSRTKAVFTEADIARMKAVADHVSLAMQRVRFVETLEQRVAERTAESQWRANQLQQLAAQMTQAEERERRRLSQVLHDSLQQMLVAAKFRLFSVSRQVHDEKVATKITEALAVIEEAINESRSLTSELSPPVLYDNGLAAGLEWLGRETEKKYNLPVAVQVTPEMEPYDLTTKVFVFQAARELVLNAVKHAHASCLKICLSRRDQEFLQVMVQDDGNGFDTSVINRKHSSGGFGLFSIRERLDVIGGELAITSTPLEGTCATIIAPCGQPRLIEAPGQQHRRIMPATAASTRTNRIRVLLADDHPLLRKGIADVLMEHPDLNLIGEANNGQEALDKALEMQPDVVLMDVNMPVMDGVEATRRIKGATPNIRVIGLSLHEQDDMAAKMKEAGASEYVVKTAGAEDLISVILRRSPPAAATYDL